MRSDELIDKCKMADKIAIVGHFVVIMADNNLFFELYGR
ncbi:hypothetical protein IMCC1989_1618 [gamma proteobacterium IMCC1989]|nr:hypothetical protein IMCC1989_1618 [gamma proteobacterium IMCC1989]